MDKKEVEKIEKSIEHYLSKFKGFKVLQIQKEKLVLEFSLKKGQVLIFAGFFTRIIEYEEDELVITGSISKEDFYFVFNCELK